MNIRLGVVAVGGFGGVLPNLLQLAADAQVGGQGLPGPSYWIGFVIWGVCGAVVAYAWGEQNLRKVLYIGLGLPSLVQLNVDNLSRQPDQNASASSYLGVFVSSALAQPGHLNVQGRTVSFSTTGRSPDQEGFRVVFYSQGGGRHVSSIRFGNEAITVPNDAGSLAVEYRGSRSAGTIVLPSTPGTSTNIEISVGKRRWSGFLRSIGVRSASKYVIRIRKT